MARTRHAAVLAVSSFPQQSANASFIFPHRLQLYLHWKIGKHGEVPEDEIAGNLLQILGVLPAYMYLYLYSCSLYNYATAGARHELNMQ